MQRRPRRVVRHVGGQHGTSPGLTKNTQRRRRRTPLLLAPTFLCTCMMLGALSIAARSHRTPTVRLASLALRTYSTRPHEDAATAPKKDEEPEPLRKGIQLDIDASSLVDAQSISAPEEEGSSKKRTNAKARSDAPGASDGWARVRTQLSIAGALLFAAGTVWMLGRDLDEKEHEIFHGQEGLDSFLGRLRLRFKQLTNSMTEPKWEVLLPDPLPYPYSRPYTLVLDLDQLLVASSWSPAHGWRTAKRPGLDYFLGYLSQWYEIVLFTTQTFAQLEPVLDKLDPDRRYIAYQLFMESCRLHNGKLVKDIRHLNRDPRKVIMIDINPDHVSLQPENAIVMQPWKGDKNDRELLGLVSFLDAIGIYGVSDVRTTLKAYEGKYIPVEYPKSEMLSKQRQEEEWRAKKQHSGGLTSMFGSVRPGSTGSEPPTSFLDSERKRFLQGYLEDQKFWRVNGETLRKQMREEQEKQMKEMSMSAWDGLSQLFRGPPPPPEAAASASDSPQPATP